MIVRKHNKKNPSTLIYPLAIFLTQLDIFGCKTQIIKDIHLMLLISALIIYAICIIIGLNRKNIGIKYVIFILLLIIASIPSFIITNSLTLSYIPILLMASRDINKKEIIRADLIAKILIFAIIALITTLSGNQTHTFYRNGEARETFGFIHPNALGFVVMSILSEACYLLNNKTRKNKFIKVVLLLVSVTILLLCDSRTSLIITIISFAVLSLPIKSLKEGGSQKAKYLLLLPLLVIISFTATTCYQNNIPIFDSLNSLLSNRLYYQAYYSDNYGINFFGRQASNNLPLDNAYYKSLYLYGIIGFIIILFISEKSIKNSLDTKDIKLIRLLSILLIYSVSEFHVFRPEVCPMLLLSKDNCINSKTEKEYK